MVSRFSHMSSGNGVKTSHSSSEIAMVALYERARCRSRQKSSQKTLRRSSCASILANVSGALEWWDEHEILTQVALDALHFSSCRLSPRRWDDLRALFHHGMQSVLKSPPEMTMHNSMNVSTSSITSAGGSASWLLKPSFRCSRLKQSC